MRGFTISQLAEKVGIPTTTIHYYERIGLVEPEDRSAGNYRLYSRASLDKLRFIQAAQAIGFTLEDTRALLADESGSVPKYGAVQGLIEDRLADVEEPLKDLRHVRKVLKSALEQCQQQKTTDCCVVIKGLRTMSQDT
ncbi:MAG: MerR family transcriptional regulator [Rhodopirellula sp.]|nr:MerR family transcriptional regulator [Rhodopirellula sp.]